MIFLESRSLAQITSSHETAKSVPRWMTSLEGGRGFFVHGSFSDPATARPSLLPIRGNMPASAVESASSRNILWYQRFSLKVCNSCR